MRASRSLAWQLYDARDARVPRNTELTPESFLMPTDDGYRFVDPYDQKPLTTWPAVLDDDYICRNGKEYLEESRHPITIIGSLHGYEADFQDIVREHGEVLRAAGALGLEANWKETDSSYGIDPINIEIDIPEGQRGDFVRAQLAWAGQYDKQVIPCDIDTPAGPLRDAIRRLFDGDLDVERLGGMVLHSDEKRKASLCALLGMGACMAIRHPMMIAHAGYWLRQLDVSRDAHVVFMIGERNLPAIAKRARTMFNLGSQVTSLSVRNYTVPLDDPAATLQARAAFRTMMESTGVSNEQLSQWADRLSL